MLTQNFVRFRKQFWLGKIDEFISTSLSNKLVSIFIIITEGLIDF